ncbi:MAG: hypothetical protein JW944_04770 [Deltaproteobacteria bacterium]|nr:hypothetical protein [Deltaproteobacteria bacterium]
MNIGLENDARKKRPRTSQPGRSVKKKMDKKNTRITIQEFVNVTRPMIGLPLNHAWRGHHSAIFLEIGTLKKEKNRNHPCGKFSVMLDCSWRIESKKSIAIGSSASYDRIERQLDKLVGHSVTDVALFTALPEIVISFDSDVKVLSFETSDKQPSWSLCLPDGQWICSHSGKLIKEITEHPLASRRPKDGRA